MWEQSFIPLKPAAPMLPAALNLVSNVGNDIRVTMPPEVPAGMDHPFYDAAKVKPDILRCLLWGTRCYVSWSHAARPTRRW